MKHRSLLGEGDPSAAIKSLLGAAVDQGPVGVIVTDATGRIEYVNAAFERITGYGPEVLGQNPRILKSGRHDAAFYRAMWETLAAGSVWRGEIVNRRKDGSLGAEEQIITPVRDEQGEIIGFVGLKLDLTGRKAAEDELRRHAEDPSGSEELYRKQVEQAPEGIFIHSEGRFLFANSATAAMLGAADVSALIGQPVIDIVHPDYRETVAHRIRELQAGVSVPPVEQKFVRLDGSVIDVEVAAHPFRYGERPAIQVFFRDISERKRLEEQLRQAQKMEAVGRLAGGIAHDFNNLIGVITGYGDLLLRDIGPDHPGAHRVAQIRKAADRAAALTRQLLAFSRKQVLEPITLDLNVVVQDVALMLRRVIGEDVELALVLDRRLGSVRADPGQIEQVILNLAVNARDAMPRGGGLAVSTCNVVLDEAFVDSHPGSRAGAHVRLAVSDTGHGMDDETLRHIFEPFFTTKGPGKGTGLGLATVYGIVKQSGGYIGVSSAPGRGATFEVYLPRFEEVAPAEAPGAEEPIVARASASTPGGSQTILLIEDEPALNAITREILEEAGYRLLACGGPSEALALLASSSEPIHLLLTDVVMPRMDGPTVARRIRAARPDIGVLYMSGYPDEALGSRGVLPGTHFITKPFTADSLLRKVREVLDSG